MPYVLRNLSVSQGQLKVSPPAAQRASQPERVRDADPVLKAWSRLLVLEQSTVLLLNYLMHRQSVDSAPTALSSDELTRPSPATQAPG